MIRFSFKRGLVFIAGTERWILIRKLISGKMELKGGDGQTLIISMDELQRRWSTGEFVIDDDSLDQTNNFYLALPADISSYPQALVDIAKRRYEYVKSVLCNTPKSKFIWANYETKLSEQIAAVAAEVGDSNPPSLRTVERWWRRFKGTGSISTLVPRYDACGRNTDSELYELFIEVINEGLGPVKFTAKDVHERLELIVGRKNSREALAKPIRAPSRATVYRWYADLDQVILDKTRLSPTKHQHKYRASYQKTPARRPLDRVEIDHTPFDLMVIDDDSGLPLGRPWLTLAIDRKTKLVLGFYIAFHNPSATSVLCCLKNAILPKHSWLKSYEGIRNEWLAGGLPIEIVLDNGMEEHAKAVRDMCLDMGITISYCRRKTPWWKGTVERFYRTLNEGLIHKIPGTTFSNPTQRGDYDSEGSAVVHLSALHYLITKWIVDVYHQELGGKSRTTPHQRWVLETEKHIVEWPAYPQQLDTILGLPAKRTVFHYGIEHESLFFNSPQLQELRNRTGENPEVSLKFFEDHCDAIQVFDERENFYFEVPVAPEYADYARNLNRATHRIIRKHILSQNKDLSKRIALLEAKEEIRQMIKELSLSKRLRNRKKASAASDLDSEAIIAASEGCPLESESPVDPIIRQSPVSKEPCGVDDELPEFDLEEVL